MKNNLKKNLLFIITFYFFGVCNAQTIKTYSGEMKDAILDNGKATYTYYEDNDKIIKQGSFKYSWKDVQAVTVRDKKVNASLIKNISGKYQKGKKDGVWNYKITFIDYPLGYEASGMNGGETYSTGNITMVTSYKNGVPNGNWSYKATFKSRVTSPTYTSWNWSSYSKNNTINVNATFTNGLITGNFKYNDIYNNEKANMTFDKSSFLQGTAELTHFGNTVDHTVIDKVVVKSVVKNMSTGKVEVKKDFTAKLNNEGIQLDTVSYFSDKVGEKLKMFKYNKYFNYRTPLGEHEELIGGDEFYDYKTIGAYALDPIESKEFSYNTVKNYLLNNYFLEKQAIDYENNKLFLTKNKNVLKDGVFCYINKDSDNAYRTDELKILDAYDKLKQLRVRINKKHSNRKAYSVINKDDLNKFNNYLDSLILDCEKLSVQKKKLDKNETGLINKSFIESLNLPFKIKNPIIEQMLAKGIKDTDLVSFLLISGKYNWLNNNKTEKRKVGQNSNTGEEYFVNLSLSETRLEKFQEINISNKYNNSSKKNVLGLEKVSFEKFKSIWERLEAIEIIYLSSFYNYYSDISKVNLKEYTSNSYQDFSDELTVKLNKELETNQKIYYSILLDKIEIDNKQYFHKKNILGDYYTEDYKYKYIHEFISQIKGNIKINPTEKLNIANTVMANLLRIKDSKKLLKDLNKKFKKESDFKARLELLNSI